MPTSALLLLNEVRWVIHHCHHQWLHLLLCVLRRICIANQLLNECVLRRICIANQLLNEWKLTADHCAHRTKVEDGRSQEGYFKSKECGITFHPDSPDWKGVQCCVGDGILIDLAVVKTTRFIFSPLYLKPTVSVCFTYHYSYQFHVQIWYITRMWFRSCSQLHLRTFPIVCFCWPRSQLHLCIRNWEGLSFTSHHQFLGSPYLNVLYIVFTLVLRPRRHMCSSCCESHASRTAYVYSSHLCCGHTQRTYGN